MCKQKEIKKMVPIQRALWDFFSVIDFGKKFSGMQKLLRSTHKIILRISTLIKIQTILEVAIHTLYNVLLRIARKLLETRENVKISTHPVYHTNLD